MPDNQLIVETVEIDSLTPDPKNARTHDSRNLGAIAESLSKFGQRRPLVVTHRGVVIAGNGTLEAARSLGWKQIAVTRTPKSWPEAKARAYALADNRTAELAAWDKAVLSEQLVELEAADWDVEALGFDRPVTKLEAEALDETDATPPAVAKSVLGDVWVCGPHRVVCGDSTEPTVYDKLMGGEKADMVWTDPPYGVDIQERDIQQAKVRGRRTDGKGVMNDHLKGDALHDFLALALGNAYASSKPGASWYVASPAGDLFFQFGKVLLNLGVWRHTLIWVKDVFVMGRADYHYRHEPIFYGWKEGAAHTWNGGRKQDSIIEIARPKRSADHPTMKPVSLVSLFLENSSNSGSIVLDPFGGSGTTMLAAEATGRKARLIELDPKYVDVICRRFQEATGVKPVNEATGREHDFLEDVNAK